MAQKKLKLHFPKNFLWGASISTHQVEGNNQNQWTTWELETAQVKVAKAPYNYGRLENWEEIKAQATKPENYVSGVAADHYNRYPEDFALAKSLNLNTIRSGIEWSRIEPEEGKFDEEAVEHYRQYFAQMKKLGILPVVTLWHWTFPDWFEKKGGFIRRRNIKYFTRYVAYITDQLGEYFQFVITINEPTVYAAMSYHERRWPPQEHSKLLLVQVMLNLARAHRRSYRIIKKRLPKARVGLAHDCAYYYAGDDSIISKMAAWLGHKFSNEFFINRVKRHQDFLGLNFYFSNQLFGTRVHNPDDAPRNDLGWEMEPDKLRPLLNSLYAKYQKPIIVTESGTADMHDKYRKWWIAESVKAMDGAILDGTKMLGYIHWSLLDNFEWAEGFWPRFGLIEVNYKNQKRTVRPSAQWYGRLIKTLRS
jgi:beta-glucosidase